MKQIYQGYPLVYTKHSINHTTTTTIIRAGARGLGCHRTGVGEKHRYSYDRGWSSHCDPLEQAQIEVQREATAFPES